VSSFFCSVFSRIRFATHTRIHAQQARIAGDLIELRNKSVFAFLMFNALFVLIVFLLQLNKDQLHVVWPLGVKTNITYVEETSEVSDDQASNKGKGTKAVPWWCLASNRPRMRPRAKPSENSPNFIFNFTLF